MAGFWITLITGVTVAVLVALNVKCRWAPTSGPRAVTGMTGVLASFVVIGTLLEGALRNAAWLRDDPFAVWFGIFAAFVAFMLGALGVAPWLIAQALGESCVRRSASAEHAHTYGAVRTWAGQTGRPANPARQRKTTSPPCPAPPRPQHPRNSDLSVVMSEGNGRDRDGEGNDRARSANQPAKRFPPPANIRRRTVARVEPTITNRYTSSPATSLRRRPGPGVIRRELCPTPLLTSGANRAFGLSFECVWRHVETQCPGCAQVADRGAPPGRRPWSRLCICWASHRFISAPNPLSMQSFGKPELDVFLVGSPRAGLG